MGADGIAYFGFLLVFLGEFHADDCVRQFRFVVGYLADVVEQACAACRLGVQPQLGGHDTREIGRFTGVLQEVLAVGRTVFHFADHADQLGVQPVDAEVDRGAFSDFDDLLFDLFLYFGYDLLDACRVDAAVGYQLVERQAGDLAADRVETAEDDGFGGVVYDDLDAGRCLQCPDVAALAADDAAFDLIAFDVEDRHGVLDGRLRGHALDRSHDNPLGLLRGGHLRFLDGFVHIGSCLGLGLGLHVLDEDVLGILRAHARDLFQPHVLLAHHLVYFLLLVLEDLQLVLHLLLQALVLAEFVLQLALLVLQVALDLLGALFALGDLLVAFVDLAVVFAFQLYELLFCLEDFLLFNHLPFGLGLFQGGFAPLADRGLGYEVRDDRVDSDGGHGRDAGNQNGGIHVFVAVLNLLL